MPMGLKSENFSLDELDAGLASGFLKNLGEVAMDFLLDTFNQFWREGDLTKLSQIIPPPCPVGVITDDFSTIY
jgi:hypothetical protein